MPIPKTLGACADKLGKLRAQRYELQRKVDDLRKQETELKDHLINELPKDDADGVVGRLHRVQIVVKHKPRVADWDALYEYVRKKKRFDLLQRRVSEAAVKEMWDDKKVVPGVESFGVVDVSITKK